MHVRVRSCALRIPPLLSNQARHSLPGCATTARTQKKTHSSGTLSHTPRMASSPTNALHGFQGRNPGLARGYQDFAAYCTERDLPHIDAVPVATCRPGWTSASLPRGLASKVVIPPVRGHRQPYAEACNRVENAQRRGASAPRRCRCSQDTTQVSERNQPRVSRG